MSFNPGLVGALLAGLCALGAFLAYRFGGARARPWVFVALVPAMCAGLLLSQLGAWVVAVDGVVSDHGASNSHGGCHLSVDGATHWEELVSRSVCEACPTGVRARKPGWSFALTCNGAPVDTSALTIVLYSLAIAAAALGSAAWGVTQLRGEGSR